MAKNNKDSSNLVEVLVSVNRVMKSITGGKDLSFAALVVVGDKKGRVGYGKGKAKEVGDARAKAYEAAKRNMMRVPMKEGRTIHHSCSGVFDAAHVVLRNAPTGTGIIAGGAMRAVFECLGMKDIVCKSIGSTNPYNVVAATFNAFENMNSPKSVADRRGKSVSDIIKKRNLISGISNSKKTEEKAESEMSNEKDKE